MVILIGGKKLIKFIFGNDLKLLKGNECGFYFVIDIFYL